VIYTITVYKVEFVTNRYTHIYRQARENSFILKKSILNTNSDQGTTHDSNFDVAMGRYDNAEACKLIGT